MPEPIVLNKNDEYFLSIAKQGIHSFMMLGFVKDGEPKLLARVGKTNDIDPDAASELTMIKKEIGSGTLARIADEGISRREGSIANINYQAYAINYDQLKEFLGMISEIEKKQLENPEIQEGIKRKFGNDGIEDKEIRCYAPVLEDKDNDLVTFHHKKLKEFEFATDEELKAKVNVKVTSEISSGVQQIHINNTCRTSSKNIVEAVLGFATDVSRYFFVSPKHESKLVAGQPKKESFYILPAPPNTADVSIKQDFILKKLYKRMEEIPKLNPEDPKTRAKFDRLKSMYKEIAGENKLSAIELLGKVLEHEDKNQNSLFEKRSSNFLSRLFSISSSTQKMFKSMKDDLQKAMTMEENKQKTEENFKSSLK